jgi:ATP-dependent DNA helicase RecG
MDLAEMLRRAEGKTLEFKRELSSPDGLLRTVVAFANTAGGTILVGVEDGTRNVKGVSDPMALEERVANMISDAIAPRLLPDLEVLSYRRTHVLAIQVWPSPTRPHHVARLGPERGTYIRVGSTNRRADADLIGEMRRFARGDAFDEQPIPELDSGAIDFRLASESFAPVRRFARRDLETLRLVVRHQDRLVPTVGGLLLFGSERLSRFPDAWIQVGRFGGTDKSEIIDHLELTESLIHAIDTAVTFVEKHTMRGAAIGRIRRQESRGVPPAALREALVNAVAHADYSQRGAPIRLAIFDDRLEIENPGLLPFGLTLEDLPRGVSKLRNRVIGRVFHALGLVEQWGSGAQRMIAACTDSGLGPPQWEEIGTRLRVTIRTERVGLPTLDVLDSAILDRLSRSEGLSTSAIAEHIGVSTRATRTRLIELVKRGLVREVGSGPRDPRRLYFRSIE